MKTNANRRSIAFIAGSAFLATLGGVTAAHAAGDDPFMAEELDGGYLLAAKADTEGACGEGKCGASGEAKDSAEGKCGEGKCGESHAAKDDTEGKCGEGKCGAADAAKDDAEGKCGEGKCGGAA